MAAITNIHLWRLNQVSVRICLIATRPPAECFGMSSSLIHIGQTTKDHRAKTWAACRILGHRRNGSAAKASMAGCTPNPLNVARTTCCDRMISIECASHGHERSCCAQPRNIPACGVAYQPSFYFILRVFSYKNEIASTF